MLILHTRLVVDGANTPKYRPSPRPSPRVSRRRHSIVVIQHFRLSHHRLLPDLFCCNKVCAMYAVVVHYIEYIRICSHEVLTIIGALREVLNHT